MYKESFDYLTKLYQTEEAHKESFILRDKKDCNENEDSDEKRKLFCNDNCKIKAISFFKSLLSESVKLDKDKIILEILESIYLKGYTNGMNIN